MVKPFLQKSPNFPAVEIGVRQIARNPFVSLRHHGPSATNSYEGHLNRGLGRIAIQPSRGDRDEPPPDL